MAVANNTQWDIRTGGASTNGGGFVPGSGGTDFSQQNSPNSSGTAGTATGTTAFQDVGHAFTSGEVGNILQITSGTGFTAGFYQVVSVTTGVATLDRSPGTGTVAVWALGGSLPNFGGLWAGSAKPYCYGNTVWIKSGTYNLTDVGVGFQATSCLYVGNPGGGDGTWLQFVGYQTTHGDGGTKPLLTTSVNSLLMIYMNGSGSCSRLRFENISFSNTASTRAAGAYVQNGPGAPDITFFNCIFDGFSIGIFGDVANSVWFSDLRVVQCEIKNCVSHAISNGGSGGGYYIGPPTVIDSCYIHGNGGAAFHMNGNTTGGAAIIIDSVLYNNANGVSVTSGVSNSAQSLQVIRCAITDSTGDGIAGSAAIGPFGLTLRNNIFYNNGGYGVNLQASCPAAVINFANAYGANTSGAINNLSAGIGDVSLSADPFTARASANFSLNATAGGGPVCKAAGFPGVSLFGTGSVDIGALQSAAGGGGGGGGMLVNPGMSGGIRG